MPADIWNNVTTEMVELCRRQVAAKSYELVIAEWVIRLFGAVIIVGGVIGNVVSAYIQGTERSNRNTTRFLMVCLALADSGVLLLAVVRYWLTETFEMDVRDLHPTICRYHQPVVATVSDVAVYTLCAIGVERFVAVAFPYRVQQILTKRNLGIAYTGMVLVMLAKNAPIVMFRHTRQCVKLLKKGAALMGPGNATNRARHISLATLARSSDEYQMAAKCGYDRAFALWFAKLDFVTYLMLPYTILLFCNLYIYIAMRRQGAAMKRHAQTTKRADGGEQGLSLVKAAASRQAKAEKRKEGARRKPESIMKILAVLTVIHIITTLPASIGQLMKVYGFKVMESSVTHNAFKTLMFANNATNFLAYFISSTAFRRRVLALCQACRRGPDTRPVAAASAAVAAVPAAVDPDSGNHAAAALAENGEVATTALITRKPEDCE